NAESGKSTKKPRKALTLEIKHEILKFHESGMKVYELGYKFKLSHSTVSTILVKAKYLNKAESARPMQTTLIRKHDGLIPKMENLLILWINDQMLRLPMPHNQAMISAKAKSIFEVLKNKHGETSKDNSFSASKSWFVCFRKRAGWPNIQVYREATSANMEAKKDFPQKLTKIIEEEGYCSWQVFNVDETRLYLKKMLLRTYIMKEEKPIPGFKAAEDRLTLLLGANAAGDYKLKLMIDYRAENPALKGLVKGTLPVIWKSNSNTYNFVSEVQKYCAENDLPFKALLILDNAPGHPRILQHVNLNIKIVFLPPNTTALLQPMDHGVISSFKAYYLGGTFERLVEAFDKEVGPTIKEFWKSFNVLDTVENQNAVTESNLRGVWKKLCPEFVQDFEDFSEVTGSVAEMANRLDLEVCPEDMTELLDSHAQE
uniref:HTH CENPB-type domain-containing protein n=1 Tax=Pelodiscus sinensis TaxID=13735 RepID=K7F5K8_PELSI